MCLTQSERSLRSFSGPKSPSRAIQSPTLPNPFLISDWTRRWPVAHKRSPSFDSGRFGSMARDVFLPEGPTNLPHGLGVPKKKTTNPRIMPVDNVYNGPVPASGLKQPLPLAVTRYRSRGRRLRGCRRPAGSRCDLAQEIGASFDLMITNPAGKSLQFKVVPTFRVRCAFVRRIRFLHSGQRRVSEAPKRVGMAESL